MPTYQKLQSITEYNYSKNSNAKPAISPYVYTWNNTIMNRLNIVTIEHKNKYKQLYDKCKDNKLQDNTTVCLSPLSTLPNYKFKSHLTENKLNIKNVRRNSKPNALIISDSLIKEYYYNEYSTGIYRIIPVSFLNSITTKKSNSKLEADFYYIDEEHLKELKNHYPAYYDKLSEFETISGTVINQDWGSKKASEYFDLFMDVISDNPPYDIIFDHSINDDINKGLIIDDDIFVNLMNMLKSSDMDNHNLAREIIANCELEPSKPYVLFLLWKYEHLRKVADNKNFKFCLNTLKPYRNAYYYTNLETFLTMVIGEHAGYTQAIFNCLKLYMNNENNKTIIKEIIVS
jgi:hypothetical protein